MVMKNILLLICLFFYFNCSSAQNNNFKQSVNEINVVGQKEYEIITSEMQVFEKEIFRILEASVIYGDNYKGQNSFYVTISLQKNGFRASVLQSENFDFFPTNSEPLRGYVHYKNACFFVFCDQETSFFAPTKNQKKFIVKKSFSCIPHPAKDYEFCDGKTYRIEHLLGKEHKEPLRIWVNDIDMPKEE